jgi:hypothetical protein
MWLEDIRPDHTVPPLLGRRLQVLGSWRKSLGFFCHRKILFEPGSLTNAFGGRSVLAAPTYKKKDRLPRHTPKIDHSAGCVIVAFRAPGTLRSMPRMARVDVTAADGSVCRSSACRELRLRFARSIPSKRTTPRAKLLSAWGPATDRRKEEQDPQPLQPPSAPVHTAGR